MHAGECKVNTNSMSPVSFDKERGGGRGGGGGIPESSPSPSPRPAWFASSMSRFFLAVTAVVVVGLAVVVLLFQSSTNTVANNHTNNDPILSVLLQRAEATASFRKTAIEQQQQQPPNDSVGILQEDLWGSEAYYHCPANINSANNNNKKVQDIVLWHGSSFTKEEWRKKGILQHLCSVDHFSVTAIDLSHNSDHQALVELLVALQNEQQILTLPVAAIVTPSASGFGIVDWINEGDVQHFVESVQLWVPIACGSVTSLDADKMQKLKNDYQFPILAIYGNEDSGGKRTSEFLADKMGAEVVELQGGHPVYLQDPDAFVETLTKKLESLE